MVQLADTEREFGVGRYVDWEDAGIGHEHTQHSKFVSVVAWLSILSGAFGILSIVISAIELLSMKSAAAKLVPLLSEKGVLTGLIGWSSVYLLASITILVGGMGLRNRRNWGRLVILGALVLNLLINFLVIGYLFVGFAPMLSRMEHLGNFAVMFGVYMVFIGLIFMVNIWLVKRLNSYEVQRECGAHNDAFDTSRSAEVFM